MDSNLLEFIVAMVFVSVALLVFPIWVRKYFEYIKDNPQHVWFKRKLYGFGWTPATWEGWMVTGIYALAVMIIFKRSDALSDSTNDILINLVVPFAIITSWLLATCFWKGERLGWQWGPKKDL